MDSSGFETRHASRHYRIRIKEKFDRDFNRGWPKVTLVCDPSSHLVLGGNITQGPSADFDDFTPVIAEVSRNLSLDCIIGDAGYDSEKNHHVAREIFQIRSSIIPAFRRRNSGPVPKGKYRRQMVLKFPKRKYKNRSHVECVFYRIKKHLSPTVKARKWDSQERECYLKLLTFNLMLIGGAENP